MKRNGRATWPPFVPTAIEPVRIFPRAVFGMVMAHEGCPTAKDGFAASGFPAIRAVHWTVPEVTRLPSVYQALLGPLSMTPLSQRPQNAEWSSTKFVVRRRCAPPDAATTASSWYG